MKTLLLPTLLLLICRPMLQGGPVASSDSEEKNAKAKSDVRLFEGLAVMTRGKGPGQTDFMFNKEELIFYLRNPEFGNEKPRFDIRSSPDLPYGGHKFCVDGSRLPKDWLHHLASLDFNYYSKFLTLGVGGRTLGSLYVMPYYTKEKISQSRFNFSCAIDNVPNFGYVELRFEYHGGQQTVSDRVVQVAIIRYYREEGEKKRELPGIRE